MASNKINILLMALFACGGTAMAQDYFDDIYYNPKKDTSSVPVVKKTKKKSNYIANFEDIDVDTYNRHGEQYYVSQIDTIGNYIENGEDFIYTQQIQKFYNPTIVVDNANALGEVLSNAYGNVEIVINDNGYPVFFPWYGYNWAYTSLWSPWSWGFNLGPWGWSIGWYDPWYSWNWSWGPSWGWGPSWAPGPGPGPGWGPGPMATWRPRGNQSVGPRPGWSVNSPSLGNNMAMHRPSGNFVSGNSSNNLRPGGMQTPNRPAGVVNNGGRWQYNTSGQTGHRTAGTGVVPGNNSNKNNQSGKIVNTNRSSGSVSNNSRSNSSSNQRPNISTGNRNNSGSFGGSRTTGGGGRSTGGRGGGGGRHR